ncbi:AraC family transcriptional regulator [Thalassospira xiamenensis]|nr:AraC family transcriptional regulator [Thalassospira xiamenensis]
MTENDNFSSPENIDLPARTSPQGIMSFLQEDTLLREEAGTWKDIEIQIFSHRSLRKPFLVPAVAEPMLVWVLSGAATVAERELDGEWVSSDVSAGDFFLTYSSTPYEMRWKVRDKEPFQVMHVYLSIPLLEEAASEILGLSAKQISLREVSGERDEIIGNLLTLLSQEIRAPHLKSALYIAGIAQSIAVHLVRKYGLSDSGKTLYGSRLPAFKLSRVQAYLKAHLDKKFDLEQCAKEAGLSPFHFTRLFKKTTGISPSQYFIRQKIAKSQILLQETEMSIIEIALAVGYENPGHFSQVFKRETGLTPRQYRSN